MSSFKKNLLFILYLVGGVVLGALLADVCRGVPYLSWLSYYVSFGVSPGAPMIIDISVIQLTFGLTVGFYVAQIFTLGIAIFLYNRAHIR